MSDMPVLFGPEAASTGQIPKWFLLITIPVDILVIGLIVLALLPVELDPPISGEQGLSISNRHGRDY
jgi:hypothetical protein